MGMSAIDELRAGVRGQVVTAADPEYDDARRVYNAMIDRFPDVVVRCAGVADVVAAVRYARGRSLPVAVRGGAHSVPGFGTCDGGVVVDLANRIVLCF